jgi:hypothetical protein
LHYYLHPFSTVAVKRCDAAVIHLKSGGNLCDDKLERQTYRNGREKNWHMNLYKLNLLGLKLYNNKIKYRSLRANEGREIGQNTSFVMILPTYEASIIIFLLVFRNLARNARNHKKKDIAF